MAFGTLKADTLTHSTAGSLATNFVVNGSAKAWAETNSAGTSILDSFNIASLVDTNTGQQTCNYTNSFESGSYACVTTGDTVSSNNTFSTTAASNWIVYSFNGSSYSDMGQGTIASGDLA
jgi:hypothetical protein